MITSKIRLNSHLAEYLRSKFASETPRGLVNIPDSIDLYHLLWDLMTKRPCNASPIDEGNVEIILPDRRQGKDPVTYNYISSRSQNLLNRKVNIMFFCELHELISENKHMKGIEYINSVHMFMCRYSISSITEDALLKNYYRWRENVRKRDKRRNKRGMAA